MTVAFHFNSQVCPGILCTTWSRILYQKIFQRYSQRVGQEGSTSCRDRASLDNPVSVVLIISTGTKVGLQVGDAVPGTVLVCMAEIPEY